MLILGHGASCAFPSDTETGLMYLCDRFPKDKLSLPPLVLKHQLYNIIHNKTTVDRDIVSDGCGQLLLVINY